MKSLRILFFAPLLMAFQCEEEINASNDILFDLGIYAGWELVSQTVNGVTDMTPPPETILEFYPDKNLQDNKGDYNLEEPSKNTIGVFMMDQTNQTITFQRTAEDDIIYGYSISPDKATLTLTFTESDAQFEQDWRKIY